MTKNALAKWSIKRNWPLFLLPVIFLGEAMRYALTKLHPGNLTDSFTVTASLEKIFMRRQINENNLDVSWIISESSSKAV